MRTPNILLSLLLVVGAAADPLAKEVIRAMDEIIADHISWDDWEAWSKLMEQFFTQDMIYDTNWSPDNTMNNSTGILEWLVVDLNSGL